MVEALSNEPDPASALASYEAARLEPTARLVQTNRQHVPKIIVQLAEERAPDGFKYPSWVFAPDELEEIASRYKAITGFDRARLDAFSSGQS